MFIIEALLALTFWGLLLFAGGVIAFLGAVTTFKRSGGVAAAWIFATLCLLGLAFFQPLSGWAKSYAVDGVIAWGAIAKDVLIFLSVWVCAGIITCYFYWLSKVKDISTLYNERKVAAAEFVKKRLVPDYMAAKNAAKDATAYEKGKAVPVVEEPSGPLQAAIIKAVACGGASYDGLHGNVFEDNSFRFAGHYTQGLFRGGELNLSVDSPVWKEEAIGELHEAVMKVLPPKVMQHKAEVTGAAFVWPVTLLSLVFADLLRHAVDWMLTFFGKLFDRSAARTFGEV